MPEAFHFPPELIELLTDCIPRLCRSKQNVIDFFKGAGTPESIYADVQKQVKINREAINKFEITRTLLNRLNENETNLVANARTNLLHRVATYDDFSSCWDRDRMEAKGYVASIRELVNVKDATARVKQAARQERTQQNTSKQLVREAREKQLEALKLSLKDLYRESNAQKRGRDFEDWLQRLFVAYGIAVRESFERRKNDGKVILEQIDGVIEVDSHLVLVEAKWTNEKTGRGDVASHIARVYGRADVRGLVISTSGFTEGAVEVCREALNQKVVILVDFVDIVRLLESTEELSAFLRGRLHRAALDKDPWGSSQ